MLPFKNLFETIAMKQKRVLLVYLGYSTFVREDDHILSAHFEVEKYHYKASKKPISFAIEMGKQFFIVYSIPAVSTLYIFGFQIIIVLSRHFWTAFR